MCMQFALKFGSVTAHVMLCNKSEQDPLEKKNTIKEHIYSY